MNISLHNHHFELLPEKAIYWQEEKAIILSDMHVGKGMHFRKEGIPVPTALFDADLDKLNALIHKWQPVKLIVVGDMFHAHINNEVRLFDIWRVQYPELEIHLVKGNHDIFSDAYYRELGIDLHKALQIGPFIFSHQPLKQEGSFCFCGHIHPGIRINGKARQTIMLPCFYFNDHTCIMPAFSKFTGLYSLKPEANSKVYGVLGDEVIIVR